MTPVFSIEMLNIQLFPRSSGFLDQTGSPLHIFGNAFKPRQIEWIKITKGPIAMGKVGNKSGAHGNLNSLNHIKQLDPQTPVKIITPPNFIQSGIGLVLISRFSLRIQNTIWMKVTAQPVIINRLKPHHQLITIGNQPALDQLIGLLLQRKGTLFILHESAPGKNVTVSGQKKSPRITHTSRGAGALMCVMCILTRESAMLIFCLFF
jgi:hypothetical protein